MTHLAGLVHAYWQYQGRTERIFSPWQALLLGAVGGLLAILGVVVLPITSGDTSFRA
ncbi:hypothetical protein [Marinobacter halodurans]|uniref:hypothetical protein n=1 Tax=Marinobacter halodurans TaxID=2528979 RepID=UPI0013F17B53|nr:hypothetical protein [Marinobacter halodurans]